MEGKAARGGRGGDKSEVEECFSEPVMIPRGKSFSFTLWSLP